MKRVKNNEAIEVLGVTFNGVKEMIAYARKRMPKEGVYVGEDSQSYPCFDSSDSVGEDRCYTNLVFGKSQKEIEEKLDLLNQIQWYSNYNKLNAALHPMAYWAGDSFHDVLLTEEEDLDK